MRVVKRKKERKIKGERKRQQREREMWGGRTNQKNVDIKIQYQKNLENKVAHTVTDRIASRAISAALLVFFHRSGVQPNAGRM